MGMGTAVYWWICFTKQAFSKAIPPPKRAALVTGAWLRMGRKD